jgi:hypothetical protein
MDICLFCNQKNDHLVSFKCPKCHSFERNNYQKIKKIDKDLRFLLNAFNNLRAIRHKYDIEDILKKINELIKEESGLNIDLINR